MKVSNKVQLKLENFEKCHLECDQDCPLGTLYDYSCALQSFVISKMQEFEQKKTEPAPESPKE